MNYSDFNTIERKPRAHAARLTEGLDGRTHYMALLASIIPALAILAAAVSVLAAAH